MVRQESRTYVVKLLLRPSRAGPTTQRTTSMPPCLQPSRRQFLLGSSTALLSPLALHAAEPPRVPTVDEQIRKLAEDAPLSMEFRGQTAAECRQWQAEFAAKLRTLLGPHQPPAKWQVEVERTVELKDHRREELVLT